MLDIKFIRENPEIVKENIKKKFQDHKLPLVDEVIALELSCALPFRRHRNCVPLAISSARRSAC